MSIQKKKLVRLCLLSKASSIELEEIKSLDDSYGLQFSKDFKEEHQYMIDMLALDNAEEIEEDKSLPHDEDDQEKDNIEKSPVFKKIHRELAKLTHPDHSGDEETFKVMQDAYENQDVIILLCMLLDFDIQVSLEDGEISELENFLNIQQENHNDIKKTLRWAWAESDKSQKMRVLIQKNLGINPQKFQLWKSNKTQDASISDSNKT